MENQQMTSYLGKTLEEAKKARPVLLAQGVEIVLPLLQAIEFTLKQRADLAHFPILKFDKKTYTSIETASLNKVLIVLDNAMDLVRQIGSKAELPLISALGDISPCVRLQATHFLGIAAVRSKASVPHLMKIAYNDNEVVAVQLSAKCSLLISEHTDQETWNRIVCSLKSWADKTFPFWEASARKQGMPIQNAIQTMVEGILPHLLIAELTKKEDRVSDKWATEIGNYLTQTGPYFSEWPEEKQERRRLASLGTPIVMPTVRIVLSKMRNFGQSVDHFLAGPISQTGIHLAFQRGADLIIEVVESLPKEKHSQASLAVSKALIEGLEDKDPAMRALTSLYCGLLVVNQNAIKAHLLHLSVSDNNDVVKATVVIPLKHLEGTKMESRLRIANLAKQLNPELAEAVKQAAKEGNFSEGEFLLYEEIAIRYLIGVIAKQ